MRFPKNTLEGLIMVLLLIPAGIYYVVKWIIKGIIIIVYSIVGKENTSHVYCTELSEVDLLDGIAFEYFTSNLLRSNGFKHVTVTPGSGDFGVDVVAHKNREKWVFQCKRYQNNLGVKPIQEIFTGKSKYNAQVAVVITNSYFTNHAKKLANNTGVLLWDRDTIYKMLKNTPHPTSADWQANTISTQETIMENIITEVGEMATIIGAGRYVFGEDIPIGKYNLKVASGQGMLIIQQGDGEVWLNLGLKNGFAKTYSGLSLTEGQYFSLDGDLQVEVSKSKMIEIE